MALYTLLKFKQLMGPQLPQDYMKEDIYLVKWLKGYFTV